MVNSMRMIKLLLLVSLLPAVAESSEYTLFSPRPMEGEPTMPARGEGLLVRRITIKPGDTLSKLSMDFNGKASYYPQILLLNDIKNPHLIFAGRELLVPIINQESLAGKTAPAKTGLQPVSKESTSKAEQPEKTAAKAAVPAEKSRAKRAGKAVQQSQPGTGQTDDKGEQDSYATAFSAYRKNNYQKSLALFSRFLEQYPSSSHAPEASFYKAESLLKLSGQ